MRFIKHTLLISLALVTQLTAREATDKPNVVLIFLDDSGYYDVSHHGNPTIETPAITELAQHGIDFTQFYVSSPACSASRYSLLTGKFPSRSQLGSWVVGPRAIKYLRTEEETIAEMLKKHGYVTTILGKWHLGTPNKNNNYSPNAYPGSHGFDTWIGTDVSHDYQVAKLIRYDGKTYQTLAKNLPSDIAASTSLVARYTQSAVDFIATNKRNPFFLYLAHNQPHLGIFRSKPFQGISRNGMLGDAMAEIDDSVKQIRKALKDHGIEKNTIFIFTSDNGPWVRFTKTAKTKYGDTRTQVGYAAPFKDGKGSNWEGGHRVPGVFCWPGQFHQNKKDLRPASTLDILPTIAKLTGAKTPSCTLDGRDISSYLLKTENSTKELPFLMAYSNRRNKINAIRVGAWKLHIGQTSQLGTNSGFKPTPKSPILFQIEHDISEQFDRAAEFPEKVKELQAILEKLEKSFLKTTKKQ